MSKRQINSTFSKQEVKFIILEFGQNPSPTAVKRKFCQRFAITGRNRLKYRLTHFTRVYTNFLKSPKKKRGRILAPEHANQVRIHFEENQGSIRKASRKLKFSYSKVHNILRKTLKWRPYRVQRVHPISEQSMMKRKEFCSWVMQQSPEFFQKVIFSDEKWFVLQQSPKR